MSPISWGWANSFSFVVIYRIDQRSRSLWRDILLVLAVHHQIHKCCFCCLWAIVRGCFLSSFRHGTITERCRAWERKLWKLLQPSIEKFMMLNSSWHMSHCGTSSFGYHFDHNFNVFKMCSWDSPWEECVLIRMWSTSLGSWFWNHKLRKSPCVQYGCVEYCLHF